MKYDIFLAHLKLILINPMTVSEINDKLHPKLSNGTIHRFINKAYKEKLINFVEIRNNHPKRKPVNYYFINKL